MTELVVYLLAFVGASFLGVSLLLLVTFVYWLASGKGFGPWG